MPEFKKDSNRIYNEALGFLTASDKKREYKMQIENENRPQPSDSLLRDILQDSNMQSEQTVRAKHHRNIDFHGTGNSGNTPKLHQLLKGKNDGDLSEEFAEEEGFSNALVNSCAFPTKAPKNNMMPNQRGIVQQEDMNSMKYSAGYSVG